MATEKNTPAGATGAALAAEIAPIMKTWAKVIRHGGKDYGVTMYVIAGRHIERDIFDLIVKVDKENYVTEEHYGTFDAWKLDVDIDSDVARDVVVAVLAGALFSRVSNGEVVHSDVYYSYHETSDGVYDVFYIRADNVVYVVDPDGEVYNLGTLRDAEEFIPDFEETVKEVVKRFIRAVREVVICAFCL